MKRSVSERETDRDKRRVVLGVGGLTFEASSFFTLLALTFFGFTTTSFSFSFTTSPSSFSAADAASTFLFLLTRFFSPSPESFSTLATDLMLGT